MPEQQQQQQDIEDKSEPINVRLKTKPLELVTLKPRRYQKELCEKALKENVIIYLGTGLGKTFITTLYLLSPQVGEMIEDKKKIVFLAPTQDLIQQQAEYTNKQVPYSVKVFCGRSAHCGEHIDCWTKSVWSEQLTKIDLMFMTPQIFASAISTNLLDWTNFGALIFDEAHHACMGKKGKESGHPYAQILSHYKAYYMNRLETHRPRLIGLTASLINSMPKDRDAIGRQVQFLEKFFFARCVTDIGVQETKPNMVMQCFYSISIDEYNDILCSMFLESIRKFEEVLKTKRYQRILERRDGVLTEEDKKTAAYHNRLKLAAAGFSIKPGSFTKVFLGLLKIRQRCGLWTLRVICSRLIQALEKHDKNTSIHKELKAIYNNFANLLRIILLHLTNFLNEKELQGLLTFTRPKCKTLLDILGHEHERTLDKNDIKTSFNSIIFVRSRLEVLAICHWLQEVSCKIPEYNFIKCDYAIGISATISSKWGCITKRKSTEQFRMLNNFRKGLLNVIVTTSVLEEGIDLPSCSTVIRYDQCNNFREYVQSRGRARQSVSTFVSVAENSDAPKIKDKLDKFNDFEYAIKELLTGGENDIGYQQRRANYSSLMRQDKEDMEDALLLNDNKVRISSTTAKTILNMYCQRLAKHTPFTDGVRYDRDEFSKTSFQTTLYLPSGCPLENLGIKGNIKTSIMAADNSAVVEAVRVLHKAKELDDNGIPARISEENIDSLLEKQNLRPNFEMLEKEASLSEGILEKVDDREVYFYEPKIATSDNSIQKDFTNRTYKLLKISFIPQQTRADTLKYFKESIYGIIVDSSVPNDFIRTHLFGHYGQFKVEYEQISDNLLINRREYHAEYLNFTHKFITRCLMIRYIAKEDFRLRCQFYIVLLDKSNRPDNYKMRESFISKSCPIEGKNQIIVKLKYHYQSQNQRNRYQKTDNDRLFLVREVHHEWNALSRAPGCCGRTYKEDADYKYGVGTVTKLNQPVIEVMPMSKEYARTKPIKVKKRNDYSTESLFFLEQFLEQFDEDPAVVFQASNIPVQLFSLYKYSNVIELDNIFLEHSRKYRDVDLLRVSDPPSELVLENIDANNDDDDDDDMEDELQEEPEEEKDDANLANQDDDEQDEFSSSDDEDDLNSLAESDDTVYTTDDDEHEDVRKVGVDYKDLIGKNKLSLDDDGDNFERWDMSSYQVSNLKCLTHEFRHSREGSWSLESEAFQAQNFVDMRNDVSKLQHTLLSLLEHFEQTLTSDSTFLNEDTEFKKRTALVDHNIVPKLLFDSLSKPLKESTRINGLLEALTQQRAEESYNLECLESVGDSYLKYVTSVVLFQSIDGNEGFLSSARSRLIGNKHFTLLARRKNLGGYAINHSFSKDHISYIFGQVIKDEKKKKDLLIRMRNKQLADLFESLIGAYLLYQSEYEAILAMEWLGLNIFKDSTFATKHSSAIAFAKAPSALIDNPDLKSYYRACKRKLSRFEEIIGYKFEDPSYLVQAFTHASSAQKCTRSYERLEYLGDAILDYLTTINLVVEGSLDTPGQISSSRSALVNNCSFARFAIKYKYDLFLQYSTYEIYDELVRLRLELEDDPEMSFFDLIDYDKIVKLLGDLFESVAGAIYLDSGCSLDKVWSIYYPMMKEAIDQEIRTPTKNVVSMLFETFPGKGRISFESFDVKSSEENDLVGVRCSIVGFGQFEGQGLSRKQAKKRAVQIAMRNPPSAERKARLDQDFNERLKLSGGGDNQRQHHQRRSNQRRDNQRHESGGRQARRPASNRRSGQQNYNQQTRNINSNWRN